MQFKDLVFHVSQTQSFVDYGNTKITHYALKEETLFFFKNVDARFYMDEEEP